MGHRGIAIETSGRVGSVAALVDGVPVAGETFPHGLRHAAGLVPMIDRVLRAAGWGPGPGDGVPGDGVDELYISIGPGSFTGLRIAVTLAKTWWLVRQTPIVAVPSLSVVVENLPPGPTHAAVLLDAKRDQVFTASFTRSDTLWTQTREPRLSTLADILTHDPRPLTLIGEGLERHTETHWPEAVHTAPPDLWSARAEATGRLGHAMARRGEWANPRTLAPTYIRLPEAEEKWKG